MKIKTNIFMIIGILVTITSLTEADAEKTIGIYSLQSEIETTDDILITGFVDSVSFYKPVKLQVFDPNDNLVFMPNVRFNDNGEFRWLFHPPLGKFDTTGTYRVVASHEDLSETAQIQFTVVENKNPENRWSESTRANELEISNIENDALPTNISNEENIISIQPKDYVNSQHVEILDSPVVTTAITLSIIGVITGVIIWMRLTYKKPITQK